MLLWDLEDTTEGEWSLFGCHVIVWAYCWIVHDFYVLMGLLYNYSLAAYDEKTAWTIVPTVYMMLMIGTWMLGFVGLFRSNVSMLKWYLYRCIFMVFWAIGYCIAMNVVAFVGSWVLTMIWIWGAPMYMIGSFFTFRYMQFLESIRVPEFGEDEDDDDK